jgi:hypothetical protein
MIGKDMPKALKNPQYHETDNLSSNPAVALTLTPRSLASKHLYDEGLALLNRLYQFQIENHTFFTESLVRGRPTDSAIFPMIDLRQDLYVNIRSVCLDCVALLSCFVNY